MESGKIRLGTIEARLVAGEIELAKIEATLVKRASRLVAGEIGLDSIKASTVCFDSKPSKSIA